MNQGTLEKEFVDVFATYGDAIFRFCVVKVSDTARAEDMTQEVFMRYWQSLRAGKEMTHTRAYLYTIANNLAKDWYKKKKSLSLDAHLEEGFESREDGVSAETQAAHQEVLRAIQDMEEKDKEILLLKHVEGLDPRDIADILGETANTISVRLNRATKRLQKQLHVL